MKIAFFDAHHFEQVVFEKFNTHFNHEFKFIEPRLTPDTAKLAAGCDVVCAFANDKLSAETLLQLKSLNIKLIALRSAGFNHVDLKKAKELSLPVVRVPAYSPYAVAEHATALILTLNRKIHRAYSRVREGNFSLEGLIGWDLHGKTVGVIGTGKIGNCFVNIMHGFGAKVLAYDVTPNEKILRNQKAKYVPLAELYGQSDVISLHLPLLPQTHHLLDESAFAQMKKGVYIINTGRGALIETKSLIQNLKSGKIGAAGLDVYEEEEGIFFNDLSSQIIQDDLLARLLTFPNVVITSHQAFLTEDAVGNIAETTLQNISDFEKGLTLKNQVTI